MQIGKIENEVDLMTVCEGLFGTTEEWQWQLANNTAYHGGFHIAAWENGKLIGYADCETDGGLLQSWSSRAGVESYLESILLSFGFLQGTTLWRFRCPRWSVTARALLYGPF